MMIFILIIILLIFSIIRLSLKVRDLSKRIDLISPGKGQIAHKAGKGRKAINNARIAEQRPENYAPELSFPASPKSITEILKEEYD